MVDVLQRQVDDFGKAESCIPKPCSIRYPRRAISSNNARSSATRPVPFPVSAGGLFSAASRKFFNFSSAALRHQSFADTPASSASSSIRRHCSSLTRYEILLLSFSRFISFLCPPCVGKCRQLPAFADGKSITPLFPHVSILRCLLHTRHYKNWNRFPGQAQNNGMI